MRVYGVPVTGLPHRASRVDTGGRSRLVPLRDKHRIWRALLEAHPLAGVILGLHHYPLQIG